MRAARAALAVCVALAWPGLAAAQAVFTDQARLVRASSHSETWLWQQGTSPFNFQGPTVTYASDDSDEIPAPGFGGFSETASSVAPAAVGSLAPVASGTASQTSSLAPDSITASGSFSTIGDGEYVFNGPAIAALNALLQPPIPYTLAMLRSSETGRAEFSVDFQLARPTPYHLMGNVAHSGATIGSCCPGFPRPASGGVSIELTGPSGSVASVSLLGGPPDSEDIDVGGVLVPGSYTLSASALGVVNGYCVFNCTDASMSGSFTLDLTLTGVPAVPGPSRGAAALLGLALAAIGAAALRRA